MLVEVKINRVFKDPRAIATLARGLLMAVITANRLLLEMDKHSKRRVIPPLYQSGVRFRREPWAGRKEEFADILLCLQRGWGDCEDLVAWRCAELQQQGINAQPKIYWRPLKRNGRELHLYHAELRLPNGRVEDPARLLGM